MKNLYRHGMVALLVLLAALRSEAQTSRPVPQIQRVLIVSVDGLRPDLALRAKMPHLRRLMEAGAYSFWAQTIPAAITLPSHCSMLTGVGMEKHGVNWNKDRLAARTRYTQVPTLFELAKKAGYTTAMVAGKSKFVALARPGTLDWSVLPDTDEFSSDEQVAQEATNLLRQHAPQVMFVHFAGPDDSGHLHEWGSPQQVRTIEGVDEGLGQVLAELDRQKLTESTLVVLTADHGGAGNRHGADDARSRHIPWIAAHPALLRNYDLTRLSKLHIKTEDTFATACWVLGIPLPAGTEGRPVTQVLPSAAATTRATTRPATSEAEAYR
jgi:arylsulfatase A-like enzyme